MGRCIVCGAGEKDVGKLFYFPANLERSKTWQECLGMTFTGDSLRNYRICNNHFKENMYVDAANYKLSRAAVPFTWVQQPSASCSSSQVEVFTQEIMHIEGEELEALTSTSTSTHQPIPWSIQHHQSTAYLSGPKATSSEHQLIVQQSSSTPSVPEPIATSFTDQLIVQQPSSSPSVPEPIATSSTHQQPSTPSLPSGKRRKIFRNIENLTLFDATPRKKKLVKILKKKEDHLRKIKKICRRRGQDLKSLSNLAESNVVRNLFKDMPSLTADFMISQIRSFKTKSARGRRWTFDEKVIALAIFKRSPRCYKLLRSFVALPTKPTLLTMLKKVPFRPGINIHIFKHIDDNLPPDLDRCCALIFDEMDIKENVQYDAGQDQIVGLTQDGHNLPANRALVFMLVGLLPSKKWKQPVAYYFNNNGCKASTLSEILFEVLNAAKNIARVDVVATICDMGVQNVKCYKDLGVTVEKPYFLHEGHTLYAMHDPPHLLKCTYSLFRKHNVMVTTTINEEVMEARFGDIRFAYELDKKNPYIFRTLHKLKESHLNPTMQYAMKVNVAAQTLSHTVAAYLYSLISRGTLDPRALGTATFVIEVDTLFDSFNGSSITGPEGKEVRCMVKEDSPHLEYWAKAFQIVKNWKFKRLTKAGGIKASKPPSQVGWLQSLNAIRGIWSYLNAKGFSGLRPRSLNQDPLENLFGAIRSGCGCSDNPTSTQFIGSLKTQILNGLVNYRNKPLGTNCEEDEHTILSNLRSFLMVEDQTEEDHSNGQGSEEAIGANIDILSTNIADDVASGNINILSVSYVSGFIIKGILKKLEDCMLCKSELLSDSHDLHNIYISYKEWGDKKERLNYPSQSFTIVVGQSITILESFLDKYAHLPDICTKAQACIKESVNFSCFSCCNHTESIITIVVKSVVKIGLPWWCKRKNQEIQKLRKENREFKRKVKKFSH